MVIYDFFKDVGNLGLLFFSIVGFLLIGVVIYLILPLFLKKDRSEILIRIVVSVIPILILSIGVFPSLIQMCNMKEEFSDNLCPTAIGEMQEIKIEYNGGRGETYYISFKVNNISFVKAISTDIDTANKIKEYEGKQIKVWYTSFLLDDDGENTIYKIELIPP